MMPLDNRTIALSVSDAPDRERLGFPAGEIDRVILSLCTAFIRKGAKIVYAGNLSPSGYTFKIFRHIAGAYAGQADVPFIHVLPQPILKRTLFDDLRAALLEGRRVTKTLACIDGSLTPIRASAEGVLVGFKDTKRLEISSSAEYDAWLASLTSARDAAAYTTARLAVTELADARILVGGKMGLLDVAADQYEGDMPGVAEEAIQALRADKPVLPLGAYGGVTRDIAIVLNLLDPDAKVQRGHQMASYWPALDHIRDLRKQVPEALRADVRAVASSDEIDTVAYAAADVLIDWWRSISSQATSSSFD